MGKLIYHFFWWFAGANIKVLDNHTIDHNKYFQIGMSVVTTAIMAMFTSLIAFHYAINRGFEGDITVFAIGASIFWGFLILNLDRFLVLSMTKHGNSLLLATSFEKFQNFIMEFSFAIPRIILAILIASVIVEPLELYLFAEQIKHEQKIMEDKQRAKYIMIKEESYEVLKNSYQNDMKRVKEKYALSISYIKNIIQKREKEITNSKNSDDIALNILITRLKEEREAYHLYEAQAKLEASPARGGCGSQCRKAQTAQRESFTKMLKIQEEIENRKVFLDEGLIEKANDSMKKREQISKLEEKILKYENNQTKELHFLFEKLEKNLEKVNEEEIYSQSVYSPYGIMNALNTKQLVFKDEKYNQIHQLLWLLLLVIELLPIILKLLFKRSSYDAEIQRISEETSMTHDTFLRQERLRRQIEFKILYLKQNRAYQKFKNNLD